MITVSVIGEGLVVDSVACPICKNPMQQDGEFTLPKVRSEVRSGFRVEPVFSPGLTIVALTCQTCGHIVLFNRDVLRSVKRSP